MEIDLHKIKYTHGYNVIAVLIQIISPLPVLLFIYDYNIFERWDVFKIILLAFCLGGFLFVIDALACTFYTLILEKLGSRYSHRKKTKNLDIPDPLVNRGTSLGMIVFNLSNVVTILNLLWIKFFIPIDKKYWLFASIQTWLLVQIIFAGLLLVIGIIAYFKNAEKWKVERNNKKNQAQLTDETLLNEDSATNSTP